MPTSARAKPRSAASAAPAHRTVAWDESAIGPLELSDGTTLHPGDTETLPEADATALLEQRQLRPHLYDVTGGES